MVDDLACKPQTTRLKTIRLTTKIGEPDDETLSADVDFARNYIENHPISAR
jgi:hypothetical protein